tara:strand:+ start:1345 stop:1464 length:120 start_codon:yes stop_codon:yes gene_type:complete
MKDIFIDRFYDLYELIPLIAALSLYFTLIALAVGTLMNQ